MEKTSIDENSDALSYEGKIGSAGKSLLASPAIHILVRARG